MKGEKIYQYDLDIKGVTDFGQSLEPFLAGAVPINSGYALTAQFILTSGQPSRPKPATASL